MFNVFFFIIITILSSFIFLKFSKLESFSFILDKPDKKRKFHKKSTPLIGGIILFFNFIFYNFFFNQVFESEFFILISLFFCLGLLDDIFNINAFLKLFTSILILYFFVDFFQLEQIYFNTLGIISLDEKFSIFFSILAILLFINSSNMIDGINGLSLSYFIFICFILILTNQNQDPNFFFFLIINLLVLFFLNLKEKLFLGDAGIYFICIIFGQIIMSNHKVGIDTQQFYNFLFAENIFLIMIFPGLDMLRLFIVRIAKMRSPFSPDRNHLHHLLLNKFKKNKALLIYFCLLVAPLCSSLVVSLNKLLVILFWIVVYIFVILNLKNYSENKK